MKLYYTLVIGLLFAFTLTGCNGEDYDFSPPTVSLSSPNDVDQQKLEEANINWHYHKQYNKETEDIQSLAKKQNTMYFPSGKKPNYSLNMEILT